jgi:hypothetical protein
MHLFSLYLTYRVQCIKVLFRSVHNLSALIVRNNISFLLDYVADCIETNVRMYIAGGDDIDEKFRAHYKHMIYESNNNKLIGVAID